MKKKACKRCKKVKPLDKYFKAAKAFDGKAGRCKDCTVILRREWSKNNPEKYKAQLERRKNNPWYKDRKNMESKIRKQRKDRLNLTDSYVKQLICSGQGKGINPEDITEELIEVYRIQVLLKRKLNLTAKIKPT